MLRGFGLIYTKHMAQWLANIVKVFSLCFNVSVVRTVSLSAQLPSLFPENRK